MSVVEVRYKGLSDVREMSKKDLADAGVTVDGPLRWEPKNGWKVHVENPSDRLLEIFKTEGTFSVSEVDAKGAKGRSLVKDDPSKSDDTGSTVVDGSTGQKSSQATG